MILTVMKGATLSTTPIIGISDIQFRIHRITLDDPERPERIDTYTKDENDIGDILAGSR